MRQGSSPLSSTPPATSWTSAAPPACTNQAQRLALIIEQKTCQHPTCETQGAFCHVHHTTPWAHGGPTDTTHAILLCPFHHHQNHNQTHSDNGGDTSDNNSDGDYPLRT